MELDTLNLNGVRVAAYLAGSALCLAAFALERGRTRNRALLTVWIGLALLMLVLGLARVIDFGPWLTGLGRHRAELEGWYDDRRNIQRSAVEVIIIATVFLGIGLLWLLPRAMRTALPAIVAAVSILGFVLVRAISFHDVDAVLQRDAYHGLLLNTAFELGLMGLFVASVGWAIVARKERSGGAVSYARG